MTFELSSKLLLLLRFLAEIFAAPSETRKLACMQAEESTAQPWPASLKFESVQTILTQNK